MTLLLILLYTRSLTIKINSELNTTRHICFPAHHHQTVYRLSRDSIECNLCHSTGICPTVTAVIKCCSIILHINWSIFTVAKSQLYICNDDTLEHQKLSASLTELYVQF
jgi:hypothetical protein